MRFKTYGLYVRSYLTSNTEDDGTWCQIEFPLFDDHQSLDIRLIEFEKEKKNFLCFFSSSIDYVQQKSIMRI